MIRRNWPLGSEQPQRWQLIKQIEHARLSFELAKAWGNENVSPLLCSQEEESHPLYPARQEFIKAVLHHDDGWSSWGNDSEIDPEHGRPYSFTEMPTEASQRIWSESIRLCKAIGPLASWVVASHFSALQSKQDDDYPQWTAWLETVDADRKKALALWREQSETHTEQLANHCLDWLQAFDWMSLWLCCQCPAKQHDAIGSPLVVGGKKAIGWKGLGASTGWPEIIFMPIKEMTAEGERILKVSPWPFATEELPLEIGAESVAIGNYQAIEEKDKGSQNLAWRFVP